MISPQDSEVQIYNPQFKNLYDLISSDTILASIMSEIQMGMDE